MLEVVVVLAFPAAAALAQHPEPPARPAWLDAKIAEFKRLPPTSPPRSIVSTLHDGKTVYYVYPTCCDIPSELYDDKGTLLCHPDGGFAGGDGRCPTFVLGRERLTKVWQDDRAAGASAPRASATRR